MKALAATKRTMDAIRRADGLPRIEPGGKMRKGPYPGGFGGGSAIYWAKPTAVVNVNSYTCSIYTDDEDSTPIETGKAVYVRDITDSLSVGDAFPVKATTRTGFDYAAIQQLGLL